MGASGSLGVVMISQHSSPAAGSSLMRLMRLLLLLRQAWAAVAVATPSDLRQKAPGALCTHTFVLPEVVTCGRAGDAGTDPGWLGRDTLPFPQETPVVRALQRLERAVEENTHALQELESRTAGRAREEVLQVQQRAVQNCTTAIVELGSRLLGQNAQQAAKVAALQHQVSSHASRLQERLLENSLVTQQVGRALGQQAHELDRLQRRNGELDAAAATLERRREERLAGAHQERRRVRGLLSGQGTRLAELARRLDETGAGHGRLLRQHAQLERGVRVAQALLLLLLRSGGNEPRAGDCGEILRSGGTVSGVYTIRVANASRPVKVYCDMDTSGGGWTVIQRRQDGSVDFHRSWQEYKLGFGLPSGEHWLGNELIHQLSSNKPSQLRIMLWDWEGHSAYAHYSDFQLAGERQNYRLLVKGYSGTAGKHSSLAQGGIDFSTRDADNDNCPCRCAQMSTGGWWFDACGPSNLNGLHYTSGRRSRRLNGIKWHYWRGGSYSLSRTSMMIRPIDY
ncbi:angiopoietin-4-like [Petromyzon marinus]|uniref:Angiopoietin-4-like n=1 Tax=Petromyzon marinus TaxID=7757 RepID=A0AAJ7WSL4_PETMA|nr:angiopoietin-4-like [Petromyzon marinus]